MYLDVLLTPGRVQDLYAYRSRVVAAHEQLGLTPDDSLAIGTGGLALLYFDGRSPGEFGSPHESDADFVAAESARWRVARDQLGERTPTGHLGARALSDHNLSVAADRQQSRPHVTLLGGELPKELRQNLGAVGYEELAKEKIVIDGIATLTPARLAWAKLNARRRKDVTGILFAHALATSMGREAAESDDWLTQVERAATMLLSGKYKRRLRETMPPLWVTEQIQTRFSHPAFANLGLSRRAA